MTARSVYFFCCPPGPPDRSGYEHQIVCLAEGLQDLGVPCFGNIDYWDQGDGALIRHDPQVGPRDCDIVVFSSILLAYHGQTLLPDDLFAAARPYRLILLDSLDGYRTPGFEAPYRQCDLVLKSHFNRRQASPDNFRPWQFGLTRRILDAVDPVPPEDRDQSVLVNYRVDHSVRSWAERRVTPMLARHLTVDRTVQPMDAVPPAPGDRRLWEQTGRRHHPDYYARLSRTLACCCFGGFLRMSALERAGVAGRINRGLGWVPGLFRKDMLIQFDSWRLWEAMAAGACVLHLDFEALSAVFPVQPKNGAHYLGVDPEDPGALEEILRTPGEVARIGRDGRRWALETYAPRPIAERFLEMTT